MGIRMTGLASGIDPKLVEKLIQAEGIPVETAKKRKETTVTEKKEVQKLDGYLNELGDALNGLRTRAGFYKLKVESSHPDIIDGIVNSGTALLGSYEFEVRGLARAEKELAYGFPDKDKTPVGFGYMFIERDDKSPAELVIEPGSTLQDVATKINDAEIGVKAMVINTKYNPDSFRLLVISEKSGNEAKISIDEDTTYLEFKEQVTGRNLDVLFEDVPVTNDANKLDELLDGVVFNIKRSEPGTRVQVSINHDIDATLEGIKKFIEKYNQTQGFIHQQFVVNPDTKKAGLLASDQSLKTVQRQLQGTLYQSSTFDKKFNTLADIGVTTNPKTGALEMNEAKVRQSLAENYDEVANLFMRSKIGAGVAERMANILRNFKDPESGVMKSRMRGLDQVIKNQDNDIERREMQLEQREAMIRQRFMNMESRIAGLQGQGEFLNQRIGGGGGGGALQGGGAQG